MKISTRKIARYRVYSHGTCQIAEDINGRWRVIHQIEDTVCKLWELKSKPANLKIYRLVTQDQLPWNQFMKGYTYLYVPIRKVIDAATDQERVERLQEQWVNVLSLIGQGWSFRDFIHDEWYSFEIPLKIFDYTTPEQAKKVEYLNQPTALEAQVPVTANQEGKYVQ